jgi:hypothetical protein
MNNSNAIFLKKKNSFLLFLFSLVIIFIICYGCEDKTVILNYKFEQGKKYLSNSKLLATVEINNIVLPTKRDTTQADSTFNFLSTDLRNMFTNDSIKTIDIEILTDLTETVGNNLKDYSEINILKQINKIALKVNGTDFPDSENLIAFLKLILGEGEQLHKRAYNGSWQDLPTIMGVNLQEMSKDVYIGKLLTYFQTIFSYPTEKIDVGYKWNDNLNITIPFDSLTEGTSNGYINIEILNARELEKIDKGIANIKLDLSINVSWDVFVPDQGHTKCDFLIKSSGYDFFDINEGCNIGKLLKGGVILLINAEIIDNEDITKTNLVIIDVSGNFEFANKLKE